MMFRAGRGFIIMLVLTYKEVLKMYVYKDAVGFIGNVGVWAYGEGGYVLVDLLTDNRLYIH